MRYYLYILAAFLVIAWTIGYFGTNAGNSIHILLVIAAIAVYIRTAHNEKSFNEIIIYLRDKMQ